MKTVGKNSFDKLQAALQTCVNDLRNEDGKRIQTNEPVTEDEIIEVAKSALAELVGNPFEIVVYDKRVGPK